MSAINYSVKKVTHAKCGGEIEQIALKYKMGVQFKCKKCGMKETRITRIFKPTKQ